MKIRTFYRLENNVYRVIVHTEEWSENDIRLMQKFGEPEINIGGEVSIVVPMTEETVTYEIPDDYRRIKSDPLSLSIDARDTGYAKELARKWAENIISLLTNAFKSLHAHVDDFTHEEVTTLDIRNLPDEEVIDVSD